MYLVHGHRYQAGIDAPALATEGMIRSKIEEGGFTAVSVSATPGAGITHTATGTWGGSDGEHAQPPEIVWARDMSPAPSPSAPSAPEDPDDPEPSGPDAPVPPSQQGGGDAPSTSGGAGLGTLLALLALGGAGWYLRRPLVRAARRAIR